MAGNEFRVEGVKARPSSCGDHAKMHRVGFDGEQ